MVRKTQDAGIGGLILSFKRVALILDSQVFHSLSICCKTWVLGVSVDTELNSASHPSLKDARSLWEKETGGHVLPFHHNCSGGWRRRYPRGTQDSPGGGAFSVQGSNNSGLLHCRQSLYQLSHKGSPRILEWVVYPFSSGSS